MVLILDGNSEIAAHYFFLQTYERVSELPTYKRASFKMDPLSCLYIIQLGDIIVIIICR